MSTRQLWRIMRPHRRALAILGVLSLLEIVLRMLSPFAMMIVVDHAIGSAPLGGTLASAFAALHWAPSHRELLFVFAGASVALQLTHALVILRHGQRSV